MMTEQHTGGSPSDQHWLAAWIDNVERLIDRIPSAGKLGEETIVLKDRVKTSLAASSPDLPAIRTDLVQMKTNLDKIRLDLGTP